MYSRNDPRFRRRLNQITQNLESANESAQVGLFSFSEHYIKPCFAAIATAIEPCTHRCCPGPELRKRRRPNRSDTQPEYSFDFYDDWAEDENDALLSLENDEVERSAGGDVSDVNDTTPAQPGKQRTMAYGAREEGGHIRTRRKSSGDQIVVPSQSRFGFLSKLPFHMGAKGLRYKPSAADLQERPHVKDGRGAEIHDSYRDNDAEAERGNHRNRPSRIRSVTTGSGHTTDSYSSRGDIFPSDDEDDAISLDDEFAVALERRTTYDESSSGRTGASSRATRPDGSARSSTRMPSERSSRRGKPSSRKTSRSTSNEELERSESRQDEQGGMGQALEDLKMEEQRVQQEEEEDIERRREAAMKLAKEKGLQMEPEMQRSILTKQLPSLPSPDPQPPAWHSNTTSAAGFPFPNIEMQTTARSSADASTRSSVDLEPFTSESTKIESRQSKDET